MIDNVKGTVREESFVNVFIISGTLRESTEIVPETEVAGSDMLSVSTEIVFKASLFVDIVLKTEEDGSEMLSDSKEMLVEASFVAEIVFGLGSNTLFDSTEKPLKASFVDEKVSNEEEAGPEMLSVSTEMLFETSVEIVFVAGSNKLFDSTEKLVKASFVVEIVSDAVDAGSEMPSDSTEKLLEATLAVGNNESGTLIGSGSNKTVFDAGWSKATGRIEGKGLVGKLIGDMVEGPCRGLIVAGGVLIDAVGITGSGGSGISIGLGLVGA